MVTLGLVVFIIGGAMITSAAILSFACVISGRMADENPGLVERPLD